MRALKHYLGAYQFHPSGQDAGFMTRLWRPWRPHPGSAVPPFPMHMMCALEGPRAGDNGGTSLRCNDRKRKYEMSLTRCLWTMSIFREFFGKIGSAFAGDKAGLGDMREDDVYGPVYVAGFDVFIGLEEAICVPGAVQ